MTISTFASAIALAAMTTIGVGLVSTSASAAGYHVNSGATATGFPNWDQLNVRKWDAAYSQKIGEVYKGDPVYVIRCKLKSGNDWCKISGGGVIGWVNGRYLRKAGHSFANPHPWYY